MHPQPPEVLDMLFERGRRDALAWAQHIQLTPEVLQEAISHKQQGQHAGRTQQQPEVLQAGGYRLGPAAAAAAGAAATATVATGHAATMHAAAAAPAGGSEVQGNSGCTSQPLDGAWLTAAAELLATPPNELPMLVPVPQHLLHYL